MAKIQILEIRPVETQVEDLSYDLTDSIRGGGVEEFTQAILICVGDYLQAGADEIFDPLGATGNFLRCIGDAFDLL